MSLCINPQCKQPHNSDTMLFCKGCGSELLIDGRYRVIRELGQGGFGTAYEVLDLNSQPKVLKVLMDNHPKYVELFQQEAEILRIVNHPGIPKLDIDGYFQYFAQDIKEPLYCIVMEKIEGLNLEEYLKQRGNRPINQKRALRWLAELALILEKIHNHNFFHRDIKPPNIMLRANGLLSMIDFGTARQIDSNYSTKQAAGQITGIITPGYTPIEQMKGKALRQSDFYALGGTMIFLLTARNPESFYDPQQNQMVWRGAVPDIVPRFADLIDGLVATLPENRPTTAREIFNQTVAIEPSLYGLDEYFASGSVSSIPILDSGINSSLPPSQSPVPKSTFFVEESTPVQSPATPQKPSRPSISSEFVQRCRQTLAEYIGPMATIVCDRTIAANPHFSEVEIVRVLALKIPDPQQARAFTQSLL